MMAAGLGVFEAVLGFRIESRGDGVCLPACLHTEAGDAPEIGLPFSIPRSHLNTPSVTHSD